MVSLFDLALLKSPRAEPYEFHRDIHFSQNGQYVKERFKCTGRGRACLRLFAFRSTERVREGGANVG